MTWLLCVCLSHFSCVWLCSSVPGILQARILEWFAMPSSRESCDPGIKPKSLTSPALAGRSFTTSTAWEAPNTWVFAVRNWSRVFSALPFISPVIGILLHLWNVVSNFFFLLSLGFPCGSAGKESAAVWEAWVWSLSWENPLEKGKATHSSILAWRIPWTV